MSLISAGTKLGNRYPKGTSRRRARHAELTFGRLFLSGIAPAKSQENHIIDGVFTQPGPKRTCRATIVVIRIRDLQIHVSRLDEAPQRSPTSITACKTARLRTAKGPCGVPACGCGEAPAAWTWKRHPEKTARSGCGGSPAARLLRCPMTPGSSARRSSASQLRVSSEKGVEPSRPAASG